MKRLLTLVLLSLSLSGCAYLNVCQTVEKGEMRFDYPPKDGEHYIKVRPYGPDNTDKDMQ
jgi:hypothetical protein